MISHLVAIATMRPVLDDFATKGGPGVGREITPAVWQSRAVPPSVYIHQPAVVCRHPPACPLAGDVGDLWFIAV